MAEPFLAEIRIMSFNFAPKGWAMCNGQFLPINQNQALFSLLGTAFGGNGQTTFALPDLRGKVPVHWQGGSFTTIGQTGGQQAHTLVSAEMPMHNHFMRGRAADGDKNVGGITPSPSQSLAQGLVSVTGNQTLPAQIYATGNVAGTMALTSISNVGGSQAHQNMQPYLVLTFCIALQGIFPSRN
jgi:microcystin-dependent protein